MISSAVFSLVPPTGGGGGGTMVPQILRFLIWYPQTGTPKFQQCKPRITQRSFKFHTKMKRKLHRKTLKLKIFAPAARYGPNRDYFYFSISYFSILGVPGTPKFWDFTAGTPKLVPQILPPSENTGSNSRFVSFLLSIVVEPWTLRLTCYGTFLKDITKL